VCSLNGVEIGRFNMPPGPVTYNSLAVVAIEDDRELAIQRVDVPADLVKNDRNVLAVEVRAVFVAAARCMHCTITAMPPTT
jgi:hypothetical protein